jgi:hypothetical protein
LEAPPANSISLALEIQYAGITVVLGGDAPFTSWFDHQKDALRSGKRSQAQVVKLPHHGAKDDCKPTVLNYIFRQTDDSEPRYALISANGRSHPATETLQALASSKIKPYCTNLARICGMKIPQLYASSKVDPQTAKFLNTMDIDPLPMAMQPCQGDIHVKIEHTGRIFVTPQYMNACHLRGDLDQLPLLN